MKELSIKEKAEAYDYAVKKAKELILNENGVVRIDKPLFNEIFPSEMEESEDEMVRKELLEHCRKHAEMYNTLLTAQEYSKVQSWIAWLEKQGEQILANSAKTCKDEQKPNPYSGTSFDHDGHTWGMCARDNGVELLLDGELKAFLSLEKSFIYPIHSQSELAPKSALEAINEEKVDNANKVEPKDYNDIDPHFGKPIDKVVTKFKVGDWVVWDNKISCHIDNIYQGKESLMYSITDVHNMTRSYSVKGFDNNAHLWDITKDAKDGDVLAAHECLVLFKEIDGLNIRCHCTYHFMNNPSFYVDTLQNKDAFHPATKEQRDILFSKMKEEGYVWLSGKKRPVKLLFKEGDTVRKKLDGSIWHINYINEQGYWDHHNPLFPIENQNEFELVEPELTHLEVTKESGQELTVPENESHSILLDKTINWDEIRVQAAIAAMQGMLANAEIIDSYRNYGINIERASVAHANILIEELKKKG